MSSDPKTIIIGAGPAGMATAYCLSRSGYPSIVYEAAPVVGGLSRSIELWGQIVDLGPHRFFSNDRCINELWKEVLGNDYVLVDRLTRIYYNNALFHYPLKPYDALRKMGIFMATQCVFSYLSQKVKPRSRDLDTFEDWVVDRFGRKLFSIFFKTYSEKLWGISCDRLDSDFAAQRIKKALLGLGCDFF